MHDGDRVMVWYTQLGRHVGNGFPRLTGCAISARPVAWSQIHVFRAGSNRVTERWATRDDVDLPEQIDADVDDP